MTTGEVLKDRALALAGPRRSATGSHRADDACDGTTRACGPSPSTAAGLARREPDQPDRSAPSSSWTSYSSDPRDLSRQASHPDRAVGGWLTP